MRRFYEEVGRRLRRARLDAGLTQQELAAAVDLSRASIANIEAGRQPFPSHMLFVLAQALKVPVETLLPGIDILDEADDGSETAIQELELDEQSRNWIRKILAPTHTTVG